MQQDTSIPKDASSLSLPAPIRHNNLQSMRKRYLITQHVVGKDKGFSRPLCPLSKLLVLPGVKYESILFPFGIKTERLPLKPLPAKARSRGSFQGCFTSNLEADSTRQLPKHHREILGKVQKAKQQTRTIHCSPRS